MAWAALEKITTTVAAGAVTVVLAAAVGTWLAARDNAAGVARNADSIGKIASRIADLEKLRDLDAEADRQNWRVIDDRLHAIVGDYREHNAWVREWVEGAKRRQLVCEQRLSAVEQAVKEVDMRFNSWANEHYRGSKEWRN